MLVTVHDEYGIEVESLEVTELESEFILNTLTVMRSKSWDKRYSMERATRDPKDDKSLRAAIGRLSPAKINAAIRKLVQQAEKERAGNAAWRTPWPRRG